VSNQNIPPAEPDPVPLAHSEDDQPLSFADPIEQDDLPTDAIATLPPSTNDQIESPMEVHHHGHVHEKKKWKEYLFQFLMLFLAVFCGFLAENEREHMIENQREKKYMESLIRDLAADTATLKASYPSKQARIKSIDTIFNFFIKNPNAQIISGKLFKTIRRTNHDSRFIRTSITFNQLKNTGAMRLIRNKQIADSILFYDLRCERSDLYLNLYLTISQTGARQFEQLFNAADLLPYYVANPSGAIVSNIPDSITVHINTSGLNEQLNFMMQEKAYARQEARLFKELEEQAVRLIELIKKEYHLE
jgi:hypothetical protein